jgi:hypothetical protein
MALNRGSKDRAGKVLATYPGPVILRTPSRKWLVMLATSLVFMSFGVQMLFAPPDLPGALMVAWFIIGFFGLCAVFSALMLNPRAGGLTLDRDGFEVRSLFRAHRYQWRTVGAFSVGHVGPAATMVVYDDPAERGRLAEWNRKQFDRSSALPETYGLDPDDFAGLMNAWRERATAS